MYAWLSAERMEGLRPDHIPLRYVSEHGKAMGLLCKIFVKC